MAKLSDGEMSTVVLANLLHNAWYADKIIPYIEADYFETDETEKAIAVAVMEHHVNYNAIPTPSEVVVALKKLDYVNQLEKSTIDRILGDKEYIMSSNQWLLDETENFIKRKKISLAFSDTYTKFEAGEEVDSFGHDFSNAASFQFDDAVGHGLVADAHVRWELYTSVEAKLSFYIEMLDKVSSGGMEKGTLNCILAGTGVGKSLVMGHIAAQAAMDGKKVLVLSMEMSEIKLAERVEASLMDVPVLQLKHMSQQDFTIKQDLYISKLKKCGGDVYFKQYPTRAAHAGHFKNLLIQYKNKLNVEFDLIVIDYLNICSSQNAPAGSNSYTDIKSIAEELRALAVEFQLPILTATQTNRDGQDSTDLTLANVSESHGLSMTVDCLFGIISNPEWEANQQIMFCQLKNRYGDVNYYRRFMVGIERAKMRLFDLKIEASDELNKENAVQTDAAPVQLDFGVTNAPVKANKFDFFKTETE